MRNAQSISKLHHFIERNPTNVPVLTSEINKDENKNTIQGIRKISNHAVPLQRKSIKNKNLLLITEEQKLFHQVQDNLLSQRGLNKAFQQSKLLGQQQNISNHVSPRVLSPKQQGDMIEYLQKKNEELMQENKQKQVIINKLLHSCHNSSKIQQIESPKNRMNPFSAPKSADTKRKSDGGLRLPQIKTPEPNVEHRINQKVIQKQRDEEIQLNQYNMSFGLNVHLAFPTQGTRPQNTTIDKIHSQPNPPIRSHFSKLLLKLPQEFHFYPELEMKKK